MSSTTASESGMIKMMALVLGALTFFTLFCMAIARMLAGSEYDPTDTLMRNAMMERIEPVGAVRTVAEAADSGAGAAQVAARSGEELVQGVCAGCHLAGVAEAPKLDDEAAWAERRDLGLETLVASVTNGKGGMPANGGSDYSDEEILKAVKQIAGFLDDDGEAEQAATEPEAATTENDSDADAGEKAENAEPEVGDSASAEGATATATSTAVAGELTDRIKGTADGTCAGCHISGVANAPKIGDKAAWAERAAAGLGVMTQTVVTGKGAMPPRGGTDLSDEEISTAITYLMSK